MTTATTPRFSNVFATELGGLAVARTGVPPSAPTLVALNTDLAADLGLAEWVTTDDAVAVLSGSLVPPGATPVAMAYAGHQFGGYSPLLGDGRALLIGELTTPAGELVDVHLKGSGRTPFARGGDGKATLSAMLREFLIAEAIHALGIPTARALAVVATGDPVMRDGVQPGAVLTRVAASHIRVGTFELAARHGAGALLQRLADHTIERHYPDVAGTEDRYLELLGRAVDAQASLIARWMLVGFIHGVMNTDNTLLSGQTIDYGPCAFLERYDRAAVFSSIDTGGRYAYGNQPAIALWNLTRLAETLLTLVDPDTDRAIEAVTPVLEDFGSVYQRAFDDGLAAKLGIDRSGATGADGVAVVLGRDLLDIMERERADFTNTFRALALSLRGDRTAAVTLLGDGFEAWEHRWHDCLGDDHCGVADRMDTINPLYIPRNHLVEAALAAATEGDLEPFEALFSVVTAPFEERAGLAHYATPAPAAFTESHQTFCGT